MTDERVPAVMDHQGHEPRKPQDFTVRHKPLP
jgi:hypothetical protein